MLRRNKYVDAGVEAGKVTLRHSARAARSLWLQVTGFVFCVFAVIGAVACRREFARTSDWSHDVRFLITLAFTLLFSYFGLTAFVRARR